MVIYPYPFLLVITQLFSWICNEPESTIYPSTRSMEQPDISPENENTHLRPPINKGFLPATDNDAIFAALSKHKQDNFSTLTAENRLQQIHSEKLWIRYPKYYQLALDMQRIEEDKVQNLEEKEQMIMRDDKHSTMMQQ